MSQKHKRLIKHNDSYEKALQQLGEEWSKIASETGAAPVTFSDDTGNVQGRMMPVRSSFGYLENSYLFDRDVDPAVSQFHGAISLCCACEGVCTPDKCSCIRHARLLWGKRDFGNYYTEDGDLALNRACVSGVQECHPRCACASEKKCTNRVTQQPRDFPVNVFKVPGGWAARTCKALSEGKVLGVYSGMVIRQDKQVKNADTIWLWQLDEFELGVQTDGGRSVDSKDVGNWTRFIRHSDSPNLKTFHVYREYPFGTGVPYLAFVTVVDIAPNEELTVNHRHSGIPAHDKRKNPDRKGKGKA